MGQKVNPIGLRVGVNKDWNSKWYANKKDFGIFLARDNKIRKYIKDNMKDAAVSQVLIERTEKQQKEEKLNKIIKIYNLFTTIKN